MKALVVAASIVFLVLGLGVAGLAFFPDPDAGEPVASCSMLAVPEVAALRRRGAAPEAAKPVSLERACTASGPPNSAQAPAPPRTAGGQMADA